MIAMDINKRPFWYCQYKGTEMVTDSDGYKTGETRIKYSDPIPMSANVTQATGRTVQEQFGTSINYDKVILTCDMECPINENTVLFIDKPVELDEDGNPCFDYIVKRVSRGLTVITIAISRVEVTP